MTCLCRNPNQDGENNVPHATMRGETEAVPEARQRQGDLTASSRPNEPGDMQL